MGIGAGWRRRTGTATRCRVPIACAVAALLLVASPAAAGDPDHGPPTARVDCRYEVYPAPADLVSTTEGQPAEGQPGSRGDAGPFVGVILPHDNVFRPVLADPKQPRFFLNYRRVHFRGAGVPAEGEGRTINAGIIALGGDFGLWGLRQPRGCDGIQVNLFGAIFSQFNIDTASADLLNTDFLIGSEVALRRGAVSGRVRLFHQSSHLGDEFVLNFAIPNGIRREDLSFEEVDALVSLDGQWRPLRWRLYGGGGYLLFPDEPPLERGILQWGLELRGPDWRPWRLPGQAKFVPVFGADFQSHEEREWNITTSLKGGLELATPGGTHRIRLVVVYLRGFIPFGQFFNTEKIENVGVEAQFEF